MSQKNLSAEPKVTWVSYVALVFAIIFFSGLFSSATNWLRVLDFTVLQGSFGTIGEGGAIFRGSGGSGARDGFLFAINLMPSVILALGTVAVVEGLGGLAAAQRLLSPLLRPLLGIPGICGLALIASFQSTDAGAGMTKDLYESGEITDNERSIFAMFQISADAIITNYFSSGAALFAFLTTPIIVPFLVCLVFKVLGANLLRIIINMTENKDKGKVAAV
jgi:nucleoside recognition membrane protein YjiH